jgi:hypothetical protein
MISAKPTLDPDPIHSGSFTPHQGRGAHAKLSGVGSGQVFHASCRPHSWSLYGVHLRHEAGRALHPVGSRLVGPAPVPPPQRDEAAAAGLVEAAHTLAPQLGRCRVWLWCAGRLPSRRFMTLLAGCASLRDVSRAHLGLEFSAQALAAAGEPDGRRQLDELRSAGIGVMVRLGVSQRPQASARGGGRGTVARETPGRLSESSPDLEKLAREVERGHALGLSIVASGVWQRQWAAQLGDAGFAALSGPAVCQPTDLVGVMKFIGPAEPWLARVSADSI